MSVMHGLDEPQPFRAAPAMRPGPARSARPTAVLMLPVALLLAAISPAWGQGGADGLTVRRDQFPASAAAPVQPLPTGTPVPLGSGRWRVEGVATLLVRSEDSELSVVFRYEPLVSEANTEAGAEEAGADATARTPAPDPQEAAAGTPPGALADAPREVETAAGAQAGAAVPAAGDLRLRAIILPTDGARRYQYKRDGTVLRPEGLVRQRVFRVGAHGLLAPLGGGGGTPRVVELLLQDDGDAEFRLHSEDGTLVLEVIPPALGGEPSGVRPYHFGQPLRFADYRLLGAGWTDNLLGEAWLMERFVARVNSLSLGNDAVLLLRVAATAQAWRSHAWALWAEGGAGSLRVQTGGTGKPVTNAAGGLTLHWRHGDWGTALHAGLVGDSTVLTAVGGWQLWRYLGLALSWQQLEGFSGFGVGATLGF